MAEPLELPAQPGHQLKLGEPGVEQARGAGPGAADLGDHRVGRERADRRAQAHELLGERLKVELLGGGVEALDLQGGQQGPGLGHGHAGPDADAQGGRAGRADPQRAAVIISEHHGVFSGPAAALKAEAREVGDEVAEHAPW